MREKVDSDDVPGVIALRVTNTGVRMEVVWAVREFVSSARELPAPRAVQGTSELHSDSSRYQLFLQIQ